MFLGSQHFGDRRACQSFEIGTRQSDKQVNLLTWTCTNQTISWLVHSWSTFSAWTNHEQTQTQGKPPPSPLIVLFVFGHKANTKCYFVPRLPSWSLEISKIGNPATLEVHNFFCRPLIKMRFKAKLQPLSRSFP